jgi:hypothetical protein
VAVTVVAADVVDAEVGIMTAVVEVVVATAVGVVVVVVVVVEFVLLEHDANTIAAIKKKLKPNQITLFFISYPFFSRYKYFINSVIIM